MLRVAMGMNTKWKLQYVCTFVNRDVVWLFEAGIGAQLDWILILDLIWAKFSFIAQFSLLVLTL